MTLLDVTKVALLRIGFQESVLINIERYEPLVNMLNEYVSNFEGNNDPFKYPDGEYAHLDTSYYDPRSRTVFLKEEHVKHLEYQAVGILAHEVSHALLTPKIEFSQRLHINFTV